MDARSVSALRPSTETDIIIHIEQVEPGRYVFALRRSLFVQIIEELA